MEIVDSSNSYCPSIRRLLHLARPLIQLSGLGLVAWRLGDAAQPLGADAQLQRCRKGSPYPMTL